MKKTILLVAILLTAGTIFPQAVFGIGQVTKPIVIENALRGQEVVATLDLFNSKDEEAPYGLSAEGEIAEWTSFYEIKDRSLENPVTEVQIPAKSYLKAKAKFTVPEDMPNGEYSGKVYIFTAPVKDEETGEMKISVSQRVGRKVSITITDNEIIEFETAIIPLRYSVGKDEPLEIKIIHTNKGNITVKPDIQLKISKEGKTIFNAVFPYPEDEKAVRSAERKIMPLIEWQTGGQDLGRYQAEIAVLHNGEVVKNESFGFSVSEINLVMSENNQPMNFIASIGGGNTLFGYILVGGFVLIFLFIAIKKTKKVRKQI